MSFQLPPFSSKFSLQVYGSIACLVMGGIGLLFGVAQFLTLPQESQIEIISDESGLGGESGQGDPKSRTSQENQLFTIDISGAVSQPGLYQVSSTYRIGQVIEQAGGITEQASKVFVAQKLNLAETITDGQKIYIPTEREFQQTQTATTTVPSNSNSSASQTSNSTLTNINTASQSQLEALPGIGAVRAQQIIEHRPYSSVQELLDQSIVTAKIFSDIQSQISI